MASTGSKCYSLSRDHLIRLCEPIREALANTPYILPVGATVSVKSLLQSLVESPSRGNRTDDLRRDVADLYLCLAALAAAEGEESPSLYWIPRDLSSLAVSTFREICSAISYKGERELVAELMPELLPGLKGTIKESCVDPAEEEAVAASAKAAPVANAIVAAHQFRWLVTQVSYPHLGKLCSLVIPCALTALDQWSPEVKDQGMRSLIHLGKNVNAAELGWFEEAILDVCCRNIALSDELWHPVVEMSVLMLTRTQRRNPRSSWFDRILNEMLSHLERQPLNKEHRISWLELIEPVFNALGLVLLAHFRRMFPLLFQWMHADDDRTVLLVLERLQTIIKLTWIRKSPHFERLVDELTLLYKEVAMRKNREALRSHILQTLLLLQKCKGQQFEATWDRHWNDPDLNGLSSSLNARGSGSKQPGTDTGMIQT